MHVISKKRLAAAGQRHPDALAPLMRWYRVARKALWNDVHEARADFPHADPVGKFTVFNIKKNEYRLITVVHYDRFKIESGRSRPTASMTRANGSTTER